MTSLLTACLTVRGLPTPQEASPALEPAAPGSFLTLTEEEAGGSSPALAALLGEEAPPRSSGSSLGGTPPGLPASQEASPGGEWPTRFRKPPPQAHELLLPRGPSREPLTLLPPLLSSLGTLTLRREGARAFGGLSLLVEPTQGESLLHPRDGSFHSGVYQRAPEEVVVNLAEARSLRRLLVVGTAPLSGVLTFTWSAFPQASFTLPLQEVTTGVAGVAHLLLPFGSMALRTAPLGAEDLKTLCLRTGFDHVAWRL